MACVPVGATVEVDCCALSFIYFGSASAHQRRDVVTLTKNGLLRVGLFRNPIRHTNGIHNPPSAHLINFKFARSLALMPRRSDELSPTHLSLFVERVANGTSAPELETRPA